MRISDYSLNKNTELSASKSTVSGFLNKNLHHNHAAFRYDL